MTLALSILTAFVLLQFAVHFLMAYRGGELVQRVRRLEDIVLGGKDPDDPEGDDPDNTPPLQKKNPKASNIAVCTCSNCITKHLDHVATFIFDEAKAPLTFTVAGPKRADEAPRAFTTRWGSA